MGIKSTQKYVRERFGGEFVSGKYQGYHTSQFGDATQAGQPDGLTATGGTISYYPMPGGVIWKSHVFHETGTFDVTALSGDTGTYPNAVDYLIVGGGGGGAAD